MDVVALLVALGVGSILSELVRWLTGRGKVKNDEAAALRKEYTDLRSELRIELERKGQELSEMRGRIEALEATLEKTELERDTIKRKFETYKIDVHRILAVEFNVDPSVLGRVLALDEGNV